MGWFGILRDVGVGVEFGCEEFKALLGFSVEKVKRSGGGCFGRGGEYSADRFHVWLVMKGLWWKFCWIYMLQERRWFPHLLMTKSM